MRLHVIICTTGLLLGAFGFKHIQTVPDLSTPKATVRSLLDAYSRKDTEGVAKCVYGAVASDIPKELFSIGLPITAMLNKEMIVQIDGDSARVAVEYEATIGTSSGGSTSVISFVDMLTLKKEPDGWMVVPVKLDAGANGSMPLMVRPLSMIASLVGPDPGYRNAIFKAKAAAQSVSCISNTKQIALGVLMYVQDYDEVMPRSAAGYKTLIMPYIKSDAMFQCPQGVKGKISYSMNPGLQNRTLADIANPAVTVLLYEGSNGVIDYRHEGRAAIAFADGHAKLMTEAETKSLIWKLPASAPKKAPAKKRAAGRR